MRTILLALAVTMIAPATLAAQNPTAIADGARVWANNCTRCHNARPSQERTDGQWRTIVLHMRARANLTRADAELVTTFLQATNLPEVAAAPGAPAPTATSEVEPEAGAHDPADGKAEAEGQGAPELAALIAYLRSLSP